MIATPEYDGTEYMCPAPTHSCPDGYVCIDEVCRPEGDGPDAAASDADATSDATADADVPPADADVPPADAEPGPVTTVVVTGNGVDDTYLNEASPNENYGERSHSRADADPVRIGLLRFELSSIPPDAVIESAELSVSITEPLEDGALIGHRMLEDWSELEATWYQRAAGVAWSTVGAGAGTYAPAPLVTAVAPDNGTLTVPFPSSVVQAWVSQSAPNYGIRWMSTSPNEHGLDFESSESSGGAGPTLRVWYRASATPAGI